MKDSMTHWLTTSSRARCQRPPADVGVGVEGGTVVEPSGTHSSD
jgi:hypothetical protein